VTCFFTGLGGHRAYSAKIAAARRQNGPKLCCNFIGQIFGKTGATRHQNLCAVMLMEGWRWSRRLQEWELVHNESCQSTILVFASLGIARR
jgi:hypothetical protein